MPVPSSGNGFDVTGAIVLERPDIVLNRGEAFDISHGAPAWYEGLPG